MSETKEKMIFITHPYHEKTKSCFFLIDFLKKFFDVDVFFGLNENYLDEKYKHIVFFQISPDFKTLRELKNKNIIFFPMFDSSPSEWKFQEWFNLKHCKIINFSKILHEKLNKWGFNSIYVQYFPEPQNFYPGNKKEIFFWERINKVSFETVKKLFDEQNYKVHIHTAIDPEQTFIKPSEQDEQKYSVTYSNWFETKEEMQNLIKEKQIYIAPREMEGIGMSFLEAMAMGKAVVANNQPTMNDYIQDGVNGYLFDLNNPKPINFSDIEQVQKNSYEYCQNGYQNWLNDRRKITDFINEMPKKINMPLLKRILFLLQETPKHKIIGWGFVKNLFKII